MTIAREDGRSGSLRWQLALIVAAVLGTLVTACMMPFVAVGVATAATMSRGRTAATVGIVWAINQLLGFTLLGYPPTAFAIAWGVALGIGSLAAMLVARSMLARRAPTIPVLAVAFMAAFVAYEGGLFAFALVVGGIEAFSEAIMTQILFNDACWFVALVALHAVLTRAALRMFGPALSLRVA